jgi:chromosome partitioning protein
MAKINSKGIVAFVALKGGSGKTTLCSCLGAELFKQKKKITFVDNDIQQSLTEWHSNEGQLTDIPLISDSTSKALKKASKAAESSIVLVDTPGTMNSTVIDFMNLADIILIPCRGSGIDARSALKTVETVKLINKERKKKAKIKVVMNAMSRATISGHIRNELTAAGANVLGCEIGQRAVYSEAELSGTAPCFMGSLGRKASDEITALAVELLR